MRLQLPRQKWWDGEPDLTSSPRPVQHAMNDCLHRYL